MTEVGAGSRSKDTQTVESEREVAGRALADAATTGGLNEAPNRLHDRLLFEAWRLG
jgi:hypothetical protein